MQQTTKEQASGKHTPRSFFIRPHDFKQNITWQIFRIMSEFTEGLEFLSGITRPVTIFGSARTSAKSPYYKAARALGKRLGKHGFTVVTGGGPGIMEAGNRGADEAEATSVGLNIQLEYEQRLNRYVNKGIGFYYFFSRKTMLSISAQAYVFFPGGYGTLDELFTILTLIQTHKIDFRPVILFGRPFWADLDRFIREKMLKAEKAISPREKKLYAMVDTVDEGMKIILASTPREYMSM